MSIARELDGLSVREIDDETEQAQIIRSSGFAALDDDHGKTWPARHVWPACCGNCSEGRRPCMTPEACQMGVDDEAYRSTEAMGRLLIYSVFAVALCAFAAWVMA